jgi:hypothetical protein
MRRSTVIIGLGLFALSCDDKPQPREMATSGTPAPAVSDLAQLGLDASILDFPQSLDPPAPAGDLKAELDRFVNVETCVKERAKLDPLVGDALNALGYDTFLRDACRLLEAARDKKRETCDRIDSSALRARCQSWVAMIAQTPDTCPMQFEGLVTRGRNPSCVAIAARDARLCNGESRMVQRGTCEALVLRDPAKCESLLVNQRGQCQREVARWRSVLPPALEGLEKLPQTRGKLVVHGVSGTPDPPEPDVDLASDFARGVVVVTGRPAVPGGQRMRLELGTVAESEARRIAAPPQKKPRIGLAVVLDAKSNSDTTKTKEIPLQVTIQKLELELPGAAPIVSPPGACDCKITAKAVAQRGAEAAITLQGTLSSGGVRYQVSLDLVTFVRDVIPDQPDARVIPPIHPTLPGLGRHDAGR